MKVVLLSHKKVWVSITVGILLLARSIPYLQENFLRVLVSKAFYATPSVDYSANLLRQVLHRTCLQTTKFDCEPETLHTNEAILQTADQYFMRQLHPLMVITESVNIPATQFIPFGSSTANRVNSNSGTLFGNGALESRVFLAADSEACWQIGITAQHDHPPPVNLEIWLDTDMIGTVSYAKGDHSWETLPVYTLRSPGTYTLQIWFVNDLLDQAAGIDRNAYIEDIKLTQVEKSHCENH